MGKKELSALIRNLTIIIHLIEQMQMIRLLSMAGALLAAGSLCSCFPFPDETAKRKQQDEWITKAAQNETEISELKSKIGTVGLPADWEDQLLAIKEERAKLEAQIKAQEMDLIQLQQQRDAYTQRLEEFRITHPLN